MADESGTPALARMLARAAMPRPDDRGRRPPTAPAADPAIAEPTITVTAHLAALAEALAKADADARALAMDQAAAANDTLRAAEAAADARLQAEAAAHGAAMDALLAAFSDAVGRVAIAVVRRLLGVEPAVADRAVAALAGALAARRAVVALRVHPDTAGALGGHLDPRIAIVVDPHLPPGTLIAEAEGEETESSLDQCLEALAAALADAPPEAA